jgi:hypothetical protein
MGKVYRIRITNSWHWQLTDGGRRSIYAVPKKRAPNSSCSQFGVYFMLSCSHSVQWPASGKLCTVLLTDSQGYSTMLYQAPRQYSVKHIGDPGSIAGPVMWDLWRTKWQRCRLPLGTWVSPAKSDSTNCFICLNHPIIGRCIVCVLSELLNNQLQSRAAP